MKVFILDLSIVHFNLSYIPKGVYTGAELNFRNMKINYIYKFFIAKDEIQFYITITLYSQLYNLNTSCVYTQYIVYLVSFRIIIYIILKLNISSNK